MAKEYFKQLQERIERLEDGFDLKYIEFSLLQNELTDVLRPNVILLKLNQYALQMLTEYADYYRERKETEKSKASRTRLIEIFNLTTELSGLGDKMQSLKLFNKELVSQIQLLRVERAELKATIKKMADAESY